MKLKWTSGGSGMRLLQRFASAKLAQDFASSSPKAALVQKSTPKTQKGHIVHIGNAKPMPAA